MEDGDSTGLDMLKNMKIFRKLCHQGSRGHNNKAKIKKHVFTYSLLGKEII